jgi:type I restriction enzyme S subunit
MEVKTGYKQTEVGVIPEEWEAKRVCKFSSVITGGTPRTEVQAYWNGGYPWVTPTDITDQRDMWASERMISEAGLHSIRQLPANSVLVTCIASIGKNAILRSVGGCNQQINAVVPHKEHSPEFLYYSFESSKQYLLANAGMTATRIISKAAFEQLKFPIPPPPEQRAIAEALSDVDGLLGGLDRLIAKKRDLKQAAMQQLLTGQTRLPGFHGEWEVKRLGDVATFYKGKGLPKSALSESGAEPCIHYGELFTRYPETIGEIVSRTDTSEGVFRSVANDVLMPTSDVTPRGLAKASCVRVDGVILGGDILVIRSDTNLVHGPFLSLVIRYEETQVLQLVTGSTVYHLYGSDMKNFAFSMPTHPEQTAIAEVLSEMDAELAVLEQRREKTRALKQAMMQELLTGRTRLL